MLFPIGVENNFEGKSIAWSLTLPGCFAYGADAATALMKMARAIPETIQWYEEYQVPLWLDASEIDIRLLEVWEGYEINDQYERVDEGDHIGGWFLHDWKPLTAADVEHGLKVLAASRRDLLNTVHTLTQEQLERTYPGERWNILGILRHIGGVEWWYLERLGVAKMTREQLPKDSLERLNAGRLELVEALPGLVDQERVIGREGELWSPRKVLRRAAWHERDHIAHIRQLLARE